MKETEIKLKYDAQYRKMLLERCREQGFVLDDQVQEEDVYYTPAHKNLMSCDQALCVRTVDSKARGYCCKITYKGKNQEEGIQMREELETDIRDGEVLKDILHRMDFSVIASVKKDLGDYFEIEIMESGFAKETIEKLLITLDIWGS